MPYARWRTLAAALALTLVMGACADDDETSAATEDSSTGNSTSTGEPAEEPTGEPVRFSTLTPLSGPTAVTDVLDGAEAAASAINAAGGIVDPETGEARPIEIVSCDADNTANPSGPSECARDVIDQGVVLDVGKYTLAGDEVDVFAAAGVAMLGTHPFSEQDLTNELSFPLAGAGASLVPGTAAALQHAGFEQVAYLSHDIPAAHAAAGWITPVLEDPEQLLPPTLLPVDPSADLAPYFARLAGEQPDGVILGVAQALTPVAVSSLRQAGYSGAFVVTPYTLTSDALADLGSEAEDMLVVSNFAAITSTDNPVIAQFHEEMGRYAPDAELTEFSLNSWLSVHLAADIAPELDTIDAPSFAAALDGRDVDLGVAPPFTLGVGDIYLGFPRVFRATMQYQVVEAGEVVPLDDGEFIDLNDLAAG